ncbi:MAG: hypothetical protein ACXU82_16160 [Caulobacteraceae bacterium]
MDPRKTAALIGALVLSAASFAAAQPSPEVPTAPQPQSGAPPESDPLSGYYTNTLRIEVQDYRGLRFFEPDHTYRDRVRGRLLKGSWSVDGDRICTQSPGAAKFCNLGLGKAAGETWLDKDPYTGNEVKFTLEAGRKADR